MDLGLSGRTAIITGGSKGIGFGVAAELMKEGVNVHLVARTQSTLDAAAAELSKSNSATVNVHALDLSDSSNIPKLIDATGIPDILVNNAGAIPGGDLQSVDETTWRNAWDLKVFGYINMCRTCYQGMRERGSGVIVNVTGLAADRTDFGYVAGTTGNAGLNAFTKAVGSYSLEHGVRVLAVSPGAVETERLVNLMKARAEKEQGSDTNWRDYLSNLPLGRAAKVQEVANVVVFAASDRASYLSGIIINVDGGHGSRSGSFT